jgi:hypothetical protein
LSGIGPKDIDSAPVLPCYYSPGLPNALKEYEFNLWIESPRNKLNALTSNPYLKGVFNVWEPTINFFDIMTTGKVCPINLSRNHLKTDTRGLFGSLLLGILDLAIVQLEEIPEQDRKPVMIMVDECHEVWNSDACRSLLTGSRKFGIGLFVLTQSLANLPATDVDILLGVIGNLGIFSCGRKDAERLVKEALYFTGEVVRDTATGRTFTPERGSGGGDQAGDAGREAGDAL